MALLVKTLNFLLVSVSHLFYPTKKFFLRDYNAMEIKAHSFFVLSLPSPHLVWFFYFYFTLQFSF